MSVNPYPILDHKRTPHITFLFHIPGPSPMNGKSSPSSSSVTSSRDSGYPPQLSAVLEQSSVDMNHNVS